MNYLFKYFTPFLILISFISQANTLNRGIELFNQRKYMKAIPIFESLSNNGDMRAKYWLGVSQYRTDKKFKAGYTYLEAANMGNPWAMDMLVPRDGSPCSYLSWPCDEAWEKKAISVWKQQASDGSGKAMSMLLLRENPLWQIIPFYSDYKYNKLFEKAIPLGGYTLADSVGLLSSEEDRNKHLLTAANMDYAPAMVNLFYSNNTLSLDERLYWCHKAIRLGYAGAATALLIAYSNGTQGVKKNTSKALYYMFIKENLSNSDVDEVEANIKYIISESINDNIKNEITNNDILAIKIRADKFTKNIKPNMFLDESSFEMLF